MSTFCGKNFSLPLGKKTYVMGILNITPDSFYDGGKWNDPKSAIAHAQQMVKDGADVIDIGAQSTRPGHTELTAHDELEILKHYIKDLVKSVSVPISVDTFYPEVAAYCLENGVQIVNDVSGTFNPQMAEVVQKYDAGWIVMHTGGGTASKPATYPNGVTADVMAFFDAMLMKCESFGIPLSHICLDMGIGFGKTNADNLELIRNVSQLKRESVALLTALSSKRVIANETGADGYDRVYGTIAADTLAIAGGTDMIRVHEVKESVFAARMADSLCRK